MSPLDANPYAPPRAPAVTPVIALQLANRWWRLAGFLIDAVVIFTIDILALRVTGIKPQHLERAVNDVFVLVHLAVLIALYYGVLEGLFQRTVGKSLLGMRLTTFDDRKPSWRQIVLRTAARLVPFEQLTFITPGPGFHDVSSGTRVQRRARSPQ